MMARVVLMRRSFRRIENLPLIGGSVRAAFLCSHYPSTSPDSAVRRSCAAELCCGAEGVGNPIVLTQGTALSNSASHGIVERAVLSSTIAQHGIWKLH